MNVYLLMSHFDSPIAITYPKVRTAYSNRKDAKKEAERLSNSPHTHRTQFWVQSVKVKEKQ
jgi:hypothetical protein